MPYQWDPTRTRGVGIQDFVATPQGLWVGSDTDRIGPNYEYHARIAFFPLTGGKTLPDVGNATLPSRVYNVAERWLDPEPAHLRRHHARSGLQPERDRCGAHLERPAGAFMVNGVVYTTSTNGTYQAHLRRHRLGHVRR